MSSKPRPRFSRSATGKAVRITERDLAVLRLHRCYRYLRASHIHRFVGGNAAKLNARLADLFHERGYLDRPREQARCYRAYTNEIITALSDEGDAYLTELGEPKPLPHELASKGRCGANRQFDHALMISDALSGIAHAVAERPRFQFRPWPEFTTRLSPEERSGNPFRFRVRINRTARSNGRRYVLAEHTHVPDGLFGLTDTAAQSDRRHRAFFLEAERTNRIFSKDLKQTSFLRHVLSYLSMRAHPLLHEREVPAATVLVIAHSQTKIDHMCELIHDHLLGGVGSARFLFKTLPHPDLVLIRKPEPTDFWRDWQYADYDPAARAWKRTDLDALFA